jgi:hypothetical protein
MNRDAHSAPKTDIVGSSQERGLELRLVRLRWTKTETAFSLHGRRTLGVRPVLRPPTSCPTSPSAARFATSNASSSCSAASAAGGPEHPRAHLP